MVIQFATYRRIIVSIIIPETSFNWYLTETRTTPLTDYQNWDEGGAYDQHYHRDLCIAANYR